MRIVEPYARMLNPSSPVLDFYETDGIMMLRNVEYFARVSHRSEEKQTPDSWERFIRSVVLQHGDWSVTEHEKVSVEMVVDRGITHEIVRHRIGSYTQESTRFVNPIKRDGECKFIRPADLPADGVEIVVEGGFVDPSSVWMSMMQLIENSYANLLRAGLAPQTARSVLPNALASKIIITYNLRSWRHFFIMRTSAEAHPQMRQVTIPLLRDFQERIPILYEDIEPGERQAEAMRKAR